MGSASQDPGDPARPHTLVSSCDADKSQRLKVPEFLLHKVKTQKAEGRCMLCGRPSGVPRCGLGRPTPPRNESPCSQGAQVVRPSQERMPNVTWPCYVPPQNSHVEA